MKIKGTMPFSAPPAGLPEFLRASVFPTIRAMLREVNLLNSEPLSVTEDITIKPFEHYALVFDDTAGNIAATLPDPDDALGMVLWVRKVAGGNTTTLVGTVNDGANLVIAVDTGVIMKAASGSWYVFADC